MRVLSTQRIIDSVCFFDMISKRSRFETLNCELCGADQPELLFSAPDLLHGLPGEFSVVRCRTCALIYLNPRPTDVGIYYPEKSYAAHGGIKSQSHFSAAPLRSIGLRRRRDAILARKRSGHLLDVGCGAGDFLYVMNQVGGWQARGIEPSPSAVSQAREMYGLDVQAGQLGTVDLTDASFDVVTMWHVLEHVPHPRSALKEIARILRPDGLLLLACPVVDSWEAHIFGNCWSGYDVPRHLYTFSRRTLGRLLRECRFDYQEIRGVVLGLNSLRISAAFWLNKHLPAVANQKLVRAVVVNLVAALLFPIVRLPGPARGPGVATFYATLSK